MRKEFIPYEQALALKELGFDEPCLGIHYNEGLNPSLIVSSQYGEHGATANGGILAPLYQQAFKWFRDNHNLHSCITLPINKKDYAFEINNLSEEIKEGFLCEMQSGIIYTYEEAELACLVKLIEIVKEKK